MKILKNLSKIHAVFGKWRQLIDLGRYRFMWHRKQWALLKEIPSLRSMKDIKFNLTDPAQNEAVQRFIMLVGIWWKHGWLVMNGNAVRSSEEIITNTPEHNLSSSLGIPHRPLPSSSIKIDSWNAGHIVLQRTKPILLLFLIENCSAFFNGRIPLLKLLFLPYIPWFFYHIYLGFFPISRSPKRFKSKKIHMYRDRCIFVWCIYLK